MIARIARGLAVAAVFVLVAVALGLAGRLTLPAALALGVVGTVAIFWASRRGRKAERG